MNNWNDGYYYPKEILEQADAIQNCLKELRQEIRDICAFRRDIDAIHIVGSGDCYFISIAVAEAFKKISGIHADGYEAYDYYLNRPALSENTMVILFSSSGKSLYVLKCAEYAVESGAVTIGVTNHADSPLGSICAVRLVTAATGVSKSFPTKTTTSTLAVLYQMAYEMGRLNKNIAEEAYTQLSEELSVQVPDAIRRLYNSEHDIFVQAAQMFLDARSYTFVGSGPSRSAALVGAAKMVETSRKHVTFCNAEEYLHLHGFSVRGSDAVIVIGNNISDHRENQVVEYAREQCARVLVVGNIHIENPSESIVKVADFIGRLSPWGATLAAIVVLHLFSCELSKKANKDPDIPHEVDIKHVIELLYTGPVAGWQV